MTAQAVDAASGANLAMQAENAELRAELALVKQHLAEADAVQLLGSRSNTKNDDDEAFGATVEAAQLPGSCDDACLSNDEASAAPKAQASAAVEEDSTAAANSVGEQDGAEAVEKSGKGEEGEEANDEAEEETTPAKQPSVQAALASQAAAAHAAPVAFYGSHRVFMAPRTSAKGAASWKGPPGCPHLFAPCVGSGHP